MDIANELLMGNLSPRYIVSISHKFSHKEWVYLYFTNPEIPNPMADAIEKITQSDMAKHAHLLNGLLDDKVFQQKRSQSGLQT
jgi:hypothetical protein